MPRTRLLVGIGPSKQCRLIEGLPDQLETHGKPVGIRTARERDGGKPRQIHKAGTAGEGGLDSFLDPVNREGLVTDRGGDHGEGRRDQEIYASEDCGKLLHEQPPPLLGPDILRGRDEFSKF